MKIKVNLEAVSTQPHMTFDVESDLGMSIEEWNNLSDEERRSKIQIVVDYEPNQPFWVVSSFNEV